MEVGWRGEKNAVYHHLDILTLSGVGHCPDVVKIFQDGGGGGLWRAGGVGKNPRFSHSRAHQQAVATPSPQTIRCRHTGPPPYLHVVVVLVLKYNYKKVKMSREKGCDVVL